MRKVSWRDRVTVDPDIHHRTPCIKGTRIPAVTVVESLADGMTVEQIIDAYPQLTRKDIAAARACSQQNRAR